MGNIQSTTRRGATRGHVTRVPTCLCGTSLSVTRCCAVSVRCLSAVSVSDPQLLLSLSSGPFCARRDARGDAGGARRAAHTMLWMCSQIRRNRRMFPGVINID